MSAAIFRILHEMLSNPVALLTSMDLSNARTSSVSISEKEKDWLVASRYEIGSVFTSGMLEAKFSPILGKWQLKASEIFSVAV